ncbi:hypothetical protein EV368DRAFT_88753 [Lentinula lateritia]|nr:hypothetical protein EV368DRAFT_88753 [Lentinula lateritia]
MDSKGYDENQAREKVQELAEQRLQNKYAPFHLANLTLEPEWQARKMIAMNIGIPVNWRLVVDGDRGVEEVVVAVQGVIVGIDLPPINIGGGNLKKKAMFLKQSIEICGFGGRAFEDAVLTIEDIDTLFSRQVKDEQMDRTIVTAKNAAQGQAQIPFGAGVDDKGDMAKIGGGTHVHIEENRVHYFERKMVGEEVRFDEVQLVLFKKGDIVEVKMSMMLIKIINKNSSSFEKYNFVRWHLDRGGPKN